MWPKLLLITDWKSHKLLNFVCIVQLDKCCIMLSFCFSYVNAVTGSLVGQSDEWDALSRAPAGLRASTNPIIAATFWC